MRSHPGPQGRPVQSSTEVERAHGGFDPQLVVSFASRAICHADVPVHCGLSVVRNGHAPETVAATDDIPVRVDWLQQELRQGPALETWNTDVVVSRDLGSDERWPQFGMLCTAVMGVRSMVSVRIPVTGRGQGMLNFFADEPAAFDHFDVDAAISLARSCAPSVQRMLTDLARASDRSEEGVPGRLVLALGTIIDRHRVESSRAFELLLQAARRLKAPLWAVAVFVGSEGRLPERGDELAARTRPWPTGPKLA